MTRQNCLAIIWCGLISLTNLGGPATAEDNPFALGLARDLKPAIEACSGDDIRMCTHEVAWAGKKFKMLTDKLFEGPIPKSCKIDENPVLLMGDYGFKYYSTLVAALTAAIDSRHPDVRWKMSNERKLRNQAVSEAEEVLIKAGNHAAASGCLDIADSYYKKVLSSFQSLASTSARERAQVGLAEIRQRRDGWSCKILGRC